MKSRRWTLTSTTLISAVIGAGIVMGGGLTVTSLGYAEMRDDAGGGLLPVAQPRPGLLQIAQCNPCNPCATKSPCNPCASKSPCNPCNPCAAAGPCNPCNPCAPGAGGVSSKCVVPRLQAAAANPCNPCAAKQPCNPCNPCAAKSPCNPCAAKSPCNPCAAKSPCNPCAAKSPCNPCAAKGACNPCNPCGGAKAVQLTPEEATAAYKCLFDEKEASSQTYDNADVTLVRAAHTYEKANVDLVRGYREWRTFSSSPYQSATHGNRYVTNRANAKGASSYGKFENVGKMPVGSVLAKDSFVANPDGTTALGPLFVMQKMEAGFSAESDDWMYMMIMPAGSVFGATKGVGAQNVKFCAECHSAMKEQQDSLFFLPEQFRVK